MLSAAQKHIALVAHDGKKSDLIHWAQRHHDSLKQHILYATGTTGSLLGQQLDLSVQRLESGPLGGDQQIGAMIVEKTVDCLIFFWYPLASQPHDPDVKALLRLAAVWNIPVACNEASADFLFTSPLMQSSYERQVPDFNSYRQRSI